MLVETIELERPNNSPELTPSVPNNNVVCYPTASAELQHYPQQPSVTTQLDIKSGNFYIS